MKVLVVGGGGREHALAWKCAQSKNVTEVIVAPGNAGTALEPKLRNAAVGAEDIDGLLDLAKSESVGLTIIGPEVPLVAGIVDRFRDQGLPCFGPTADAAQLEGSKAFTKDFLQRHNIPTATFRRCGSSAVPALPGATMTSETFSDWAHFHASACSRPPLPTTSTFID